MIDISGIDKAELLAELVNNGRPLGLGVLNAGRLSVEEAREILAHDNYVDYCKGVPIKARFSGDSFNGNLYNRDNGWNAAERVVSALKGSPAW